MSEQSSEWQPRAPLEPVELLNQLHAERGLLPVRFSKKTKESSQDRTIDPEAKEAIFLKVLLDLFPECTKGTKSEFTVEEVRVAFVEYEKKLKTAQGDSVPKARFTGKVGARRKRIV